MARFAVRSLYHWAPCWPADTEAANLPYLYEERIVLFQASSDKEALETAFAEAEAYAEQNQAEFLRQVDAFRYDDGDQEIFSCLRRSSLDTAAFKTAFYRDIDNQTRLAGSDQVN